MIVETVGINPRPSDSFEDEWVLRLRFIRGIRAGMLELFPPSN